MTMSRPMGWIGLIVGIVLILLAIFAAQLGLGGTNLTGLKHIILLVAGVVLLVGGLVVAMRGQPA